MEHFYKGVDAALSGKYKDSEILSQRRDWFKSKETYEEYKAWCGNITMSDYAPCKAYKDVCGLTPQQNPPDDQLAWTDFLRGWEIVFITRDGTDGWMGNRLDDKCLCVAIIFDLSKLNANQVFRLWYYISDDHGLNNLERWYEANSSIAEYGSGVPGHWEPKEFSPDQHWVDGDWSGENYWLVCGSGLWNGDLLRFLIDEFPDNSYHVVPDPNL